MRSNERSRESDYYRERYWIANERALLFGVSREIACSRISEITEYLDICRSNQDFHSFVLSFTSLSKSLSLVSGRAFLEMGV
jgi:hypothetical protein